MALVLVVDDEPDVRLVARVVLTSAGHQVVEAESGEEALDHLESDLSPDAVLLDVRMPGIDGWEVLRRLEEMGRFPRTPVVLLSAQVDAVTAARAVELGVHAHLAKPFSAAELSRVLGRLVTAA